MQALFKTFIILFALTLSFSMTAADRTAKDFTLPTLDGATITLSEYKDQAVVLVFWATWCPYCKKLLPGIERLHQTYGEKGLKVIAINVMEDGDPAAYIKQHNYSFSVALKGDSIMNNFMVPATPTIAILSKNNQWHDHLNLSDPNSLKLENSIRTAMGLDKLEKSED
ncbi:TlpA disulfide reductase family protein [Pleionea litopenaei]|uniref:TlpA disulfide reductase family protein n=1 Tax=Pleionea litopenaei TaxID=3070815 RepID=A0AA51RT66_9GAMM|nr:TlpA disulfide reductase family protein [Pleionea sp. HL-JVS1]WMS87166.1 TlpA disulfide reductase family protein [Pleionea sp. HL-JVS1]